MRAATVDGSSLTGRLAFLLYGSGLRLLECARLRVKDLDFATRQIVVRRGKGDRIQTLAAVFGRYTRTVQISLGERQAAEVDISKTCSRDSGGRRHDDEDRVRGAGGRRGRGGGHAGPQLMRASRNRPDLALRSSSTP